MHTVKRAWNHMVYILISEKLFRSLLVNLKKDRIMTGKEFPSVVYQRVTIISLSCLYPLPVCETWWSQSMSQSTAFHYQWDGSPKTSKSPNFLYLTDKNSLTKNKKTNPVFRIPNRPLLKLRTTTFWFALVET